MTLLDAGQLIRIYDEIIHAGRRLGRNMILDGRSAAYMIEDTTARIPVRPVAHNPRINVLDQGRLGSCTGNAGTYALSSLYDAPSVDNEPLDEAFAIELYSEATVEDGLRGKYPPDDDGSSGLGVCRALHGDGMIGAYRWARSVDGIGRLLQTGGVMFGMPWYAAWFDPDRHGFIDHADDPGPLAGGHEVYVAELEAWDDDDPHGCVIRFVNSWSASWGDSGSGRMRLSTYERYKADIDVKQLSR